MLATPEAMLPVTVENDTLAFLQRQKGAWSDREAQAVPYLLVSCVGKVVKAEASVVPGESEEREAKAGPPRS